MAREAWTDERLDDLATAMRGGFARVDQDLRDLRGGIAELRQTMFRFGWGTMVGFVTVLAAIVARGA